jgi:AraC-like DNA-binding protein
MKSAEQELFTNDLDQKAGESIHRRDFGYYNLQGLQFKLPDTKRLNNFVLLHVDQGRGSFNLALESYEIKSRSIFFAYPGQLISKINLKDVSGYLLFGSPDFMLQANPQFLDMKLFQLYGRSHEMILSEEKHIKLNSIAKSIQEERNSPDPYRKDEILKNLVNVHIYYTDRYVYHTYYEKEKALHPKVRGFFALMNIKQNVNLKVSDYASELNVAPNYLNQLVKEQTGKTVKTLIKEKTIRQACVYLLHTDYDIKEIAYRLEYNYPQYFVRDFKNAIGKTPLQYRKTNR